MFYRLLGMLVWKGSKSFLRRKNWPTMLPAPVIAVAVVIVVLLVGLLFVKRASD
jgi:hypothetical protein